jgi:hypothetical protein
MRFFSSGMTTARVMMQEAAPKMAPTYVANPSVHRSAGSSGTHTACGSDNLPSDSAVYFTHSFAVKLLTATVSPCIVLCAGLNDEADDEPEDAAHKNRQGLQQQI